MSAWRPSFVVNLKLAFDEALHVQELSRPTSVEEQIAEASRPAGEVRLEPLITRRGSENESFVMNRVPRSASVSLPGYRQAATFEFEMSYADLPIDPRTVRACAVEIYLGAVSPDDFAAGMRGVEEDGSRRSILRTRTATDFPNNAALLMTGLVDEWDVEHSESGSKAMLKGRDLRGALLDTPISVLPNAAAQLLESLDLAQPIDTVVVQILDFNPMFQSIDVMVNPGEWPDGEVPSPFDPDLVPRHRRGARGSGNRGSTGGGDSNSLNFWDLIVRFCYLVGAIPHFVGNQLRIRPARSIFDQARQGFFPDQPTPFANGDFRDRDPLTNAVISPALNFRRVVYGRDTDSISFNRKYGGFQRPRVVRAISHDNSSPNRGVRAGGGSQRTLVGTWPPAAELEARRTRRSAGGQQSQEEVLTIATVPGIRDVRRLEQIARGVYEEIGRGEMGGSCRTKSLSSFGGTNADPDLLRLKPGDGVEFMADSRARTGAVPAVSSLTESVRRSFEEQVAEVRSRIGNENLSRVIVATSRGQIAELQRFFRVGSVRYTWGEHGVEITFDFQNYVVVRNQVGEQATDPPNTQVRRTTTRSVVMELAPIQIEGSADGEVIQGEEILIMGRRSDG